METCCLEELSQAQTGHEGKYDGREAGVREAVAKETLEAIQNLSDLGEGLTNFFPPEQEAKNILLFGHSFVWI